MTNATRKAKILILARLDEAISKIEELEGFFIYESRFSIRLEELKELRKLLHEKETLGEIADILMSEGLFYELTDTNHSTQPKATPPKEGKSSMEAIGEDTADLLSRLYRMNLNHPICLHYTLHCSFEKARKALQTAYDETIRLKEGWEE